MPQVKTKRAKFDTYNKGARVEDPNTKKGWRVDRSKPFDENDTLFCRKGEVYYEWSFRYGGTHRSKTYPKPSQLTQSDFLSQAYSLREQIEGFTSTDLEDIESLLSDISMDLDQLRDETEEKYDNLPESLQESETGELLEERLEMMEEAVSFFEDIEERVRDSSTKDVLYEMKEENPLNEL